MSSASRLITLAFVLALAAAPASAAPRRSPPVPAAGVSAFKSAQQRRLMLEPLERRHEARERAERLRELRGLARRLNRSGQSTLRAVGQRSRPEAPESDLNLPAPAAPSAPSLRRDEPPAVRSGLAALPNVRCNDPSGDLLSDGFGNTVVEGQCETTIARWGSYMVAAWNDSKGYDDGTLQTQGYATSVDGGLTWIDRGTFPIPGAYGTWQWTSDPVLAVNPTTGAFYFAALGDIPLSQNAIGVAKGRFNGSSFSWGTVSAARVVSSAFEFLDKEWIAVDPADGRVYLSYTRFTAMDEIDFQWADSSLATWSAPRKLSTDGENGWVQGSRPAVGANGEVWVAYYRIGTQFTDFLRICRSTDRGGSFSAPVDAVSFYSNYGSGAPGFNRGMGIQFPSIAVDCSGGERDGRVYIAWNESLNWYDDAGSVGLGTNRNELEPNGNAATATPAAVGQVLRGTLASASDEDWYAITLAAGQSIIAEADSIGSGIVKPYTYVALRLFAPDGVTRLAFVDFDSGDIIPGYAPPSWVFMAPAAGTYYLRAATTYSSGSGYRLSTGYASRLLERGRDHRDVFVAWSDDGTAWSAPVRVSQSPAGFDDWLPEVAVAPDGQVACAWYDWRDSPASTAGGESHVYLALSDDGGATWTEQGPMSDVRTAWTSVRTNIAPNQGDYISLISTYEGTAVCWADGRDLNPDTYMEWIASNRPVPTRIVADTSGIDITWFMDRTPGTTAALYRQVGASSTWDSLTTLTLDASRHLRYVDADVDVDVTYRYQLGVVTGGTEVFYPPVVVRIVPPPTRLELAGAWPNPAKRTDRIVFTLVGSAPATLRLYDVTGREVLSRRVTGSSFPLSEAGSIRPGVYIVKLTQGGQSASRRIVLL